MLRLLLAVSLWLVSQLFGAVSAQSADRIVFINPGARGEDFWENVSLSMHAAAEQLGFELEVLWAGRNKFNMQKLGVAVAERDDKPAIMILVNEERAASPILQAAEKAGIKTIFLSNALSREEITEFEARNGPLKHMLGSVVPDLYQAGLRMARAMIEEADHRQLHSKDGKLHVVAIAGDEISNSSLQRNEGFLDYIKSRDDVTVERLLVANWNENEALQLMQRLLELMQRRQDRLAGIWAGNDPMAIGAMKALSGAGLVPGKDTVVVGINWSSAAIQRIKDREMLLSDGGHFLAGAWLIVALADYKKGCEIGVGNQARQLDLPTSALDATTDPALFTLILQRDYRSIDFSHFLSHHSQCGAYDFTAENLVRSLQDKQKNDN